VSRCQGCAYLASLASLSCEVCGDGWAGWTSRRPGAGCWCWWLSRRASACVFAGLGSLLGRSAQCSCVLTAALYLEAGRGRVIIVSRQTKKRKRTIKAYHCLCHAGGSSCRRRHGGQSMRWKYIVWCEWGRTKSIKSNTVGILLSSSSVVVVVGWSPPSTSSSTLELVVLLVSQRQQPLSLSCVVVVMRCHCCRCQW